MHTLWLVFGSCGPAVLAAGWQNGQRSWAAHGPKPLRVQSLNPSKDPKFAVKLPGLVRLYIRLACAL